MSTNIFEIPTLRLETEPVRMVTIVPHTDPLWEQLVNKRHSDVFHSPAWLRVLVDTYGFDVRANVLVNDAGEAVAGLAYTHLRDPMGDRVAALPFCDFSDPLVDTREQWNLLVQPLLDLNCPIQIRCLHNAVALEDTRFETGKIAKWHLVGLTEPVEQIWVDRLDSPTRRAVKKARNEGVEVTFHDDLDSMRAFFEVHLGVRKKKYRLLAQPFAFLENIWKHCVATGMGTLMLARHQGQVISGGLAIRWKDTMYYKLSGSVREEQTVRPSDIMFWSLVEESKRRGCNAVDFGLSDWDQDGLIRFKRKYSTEEKTITFLKHTPAGHQLSDGQLQVRRTMGDLTSLLTEPGVPDAVTERGGDLLYRHFA
jgi:CelD/BcsL family acetyltransferase involved in cellulose biosynthesis